MREWLVNKRKEKKMTQKQVAKEVGISRSFYSEIENGAKYPGGKTAKKIADALKFDMDIFFDEKGLKMRRNKKHPA